MSEITEQHEEGMETEVVTKHPKEKSKHPLLDTYATNLRTQWEEGKLEDVIGRDDEIYQLIVALSCKKKNSIVLVGDAGVGKSSLLTGLQKRICENKVNKKLIGKTIFELSFGTLAGGCSLKGSFEKRMQGIISELIENQEDIIMFADEGHLIFSLGNPSGSMDAANMLKPALAKGEIKMVTATDFASFKKSFERDATMERRFTKIVINEPNIEQTREILMKSKVLYEDFSSVIIKPEIVDLTIQYANRFLTGKFNPDKSLSLLDNVSAFVNVANYEKNISPEVTLLEQNLQTATKLRESSAKKQDFEEAMKQKVIALDLARKLEIAKEEWKEQNKNNRTEVTEDDLAVVVSKISGIPVSKISLSESTKLLNIDKELSASVIGQDEAVKKVAECLQLSRSGVLTNGHKPIASFLFLGSTGVGKSSLVRKLSEVMFGSEESNLVRLDMNEYSSAHDVQKFLGAPPSYVGFGEHSVVDRIREKGGYCIVVFEEIEKAHKNCLTPLISIMDTGFMTDSQDRKIDFSNTIIVMTSNLGTDKLGIQKVGFGLNESNDDRRGILEKEVKKYLAPEFINRIDEIVYFNHLTKDNAKDIVEIEVNKFINTVKSTNEITVEVTDKLKGIVLEQGFSAEYGARNIQRVCRHLLQKPLSIKILEEKIVKSTEGINLMDWDSEKKETIVSIKKVGGRKKQ